jgi:antibiotic biosynthesis monooxygenase (ABM) superfamily enzyme
MICRIWRGWTTPENAAAYEDLVRGQVIPGIEARAIPGFRHIDLMRREADGEIEFRTLMWFDDLASIRAFIARQRTFVGYLRRGLRPGTAAKPRKIGG